MNDQITMNQLVALQTSYNRWEASQIHEGGDPRARRLAWASEQCGRKVASFNALDQQEARRLLDTLRLSLGEPERPRPRRMRSRDRARAAGSEGRRGVATNVTLVSAADLARIDDALTRLGWTRERFDAWLRSASSPLGRRANPEIRTLADANRAWWPLKAMLRRAGKWTPADDNRFEPVAENAR